MIKPPRYDPLPPIGCGEYDAVGCQISHQVNGFYRHWHGKKDYERDVVLKDEAAGDAPVDWSDRIHRLSLSLFEFAAAFERLSLDEKNKAIGDGGANHFGIIALAAVRDLTDANCIDIDAGNRNGIDRVLTKLYNHTKDERSE